MVSTRFVLVITVWSYQCLPNFLMYYQVNEEEIIHMLSRVSLATGVTASENSTYADTPSLPSTPKILPQVKQLVLPNHFTLGLRVPSPLQQQSGSASSSMWRPRPITADLTVDQLLAQIQLGIDLD